MITDHDDLGPGEIRRGFERIEKQLAGMQSDVSTRYNDLANKMNAALGPVSELRYRCEQQEKDMGEVAEKLRVVEQVQAAKIRDIEQRQNISDVRSASIAGGIAVLGFVLKFWLLGK